MRASLEALTAEISLQGNRVDAVVSYSDLKSGETGYLTGVPMLAKYFYELARLIDIDGTDLFKRCVFTMDPNGHYDANFSYE
jgi:hypothetical protein